MLLFVVQDTFAMERHRQ